MLAVGSVVLGTGILLAGLLAVLFRHPRAPRWTRPEAVAFLILVPVSAMISLGSGGTVFGLYGVLAGWTDPRQLVALVALPVVLVLVWHGLGIHRRLRANALATAGETASVIPLADIGLAGSVDVPPDAPVPGKLPRRPKREAA